jgi:hypothetical protein
MPYLICQNCGGYYQLDDDESPEDFDSCQCGGKLIYSEYLESKSRMGKKKFYGALSVIAILTILVAGYIVFLPHFNEVSASNPSVIATDYRGSVSKETITATNATSNDTANKKTIAVITGMHPREKLSIKTVSDMVNQYSLSSNQAIIHYTVNVTNNPENYVTGRANGEELVANYVIPDIKKSNVDVVIICHDHAPGYGRGYYVATPKMDSPSVAIGETVEKNLPEFTYYRATAHSEHGSSTYTVSNPLASAGIRTVVYEMPEWATYNQAFQESKKLIGTCFQVIN